MGEASVRSGSQGEKIASEILKLIGWKSLSTNMDIGCSALSKHKIDSTGKRHGIDILYSYDNPLYHGNRDVVIGSVKHSQNNENQDINKHISELAVSLHCASLSDEITKQVGLSKLKKCYKGLLFCLSSADNKVDIDNKKKSGKEEDKRDFNLINSIRPDLDFGGNKFEEIYIVDTCKANFLFSCIKTAEAYMRNSSIQFLYQNTGKNMNPNQLLIYKDRLPIQLINSEIIPIIKEENGKISCLIFCSNSFRTETLSRLIWFSHKLCGLTNEIRLYFPDYDNDKEYLVNSVKQTFNDENLAFKISVHRMGKHDFITLKEEQIPYSPTNYNTQNIQDTELVLSQNIEDDIEKILPYGDMLIPKLRTPILSETTLSHFLLRKGIVTNKKSKDDLLPIFSCLLLSPEELDWLKGKYREREDRPKQIERKVFADFKGNSLWEIMNDQLNKVKDLKNISLPSTCSFFQEPFVERVDNNDDHLIMKYTIEREHVDKDFLNGKTRHDGQIEMKYQDNTLTYTDIHSSGDTSLVNKKHFTAVTKSLKQNNFINDEFKAITFLDFDNKNRIKFFLSFLELYQSKKTIDFSNINLVKMRFNVDESIPTMPADLTSLKGRVTDMRFEGKELSSTIYLSSSEYKDAELFEKMTFSISYKYLNRRGHFYLDLSFSNALNKTGLPNDTELTVSITPSKDNPDYDFARTKSKIMDEVNKLKDVSYEQFKRKRSQELSNDSKFSEACITEEKNAL